MMRQRLSRFKSGDSDVESPVLRVSAGRTFNDLLPSSLHSKRPSRNGLAVAVQLYLLFAPWAEDWRLMSGRPGATLVLAGGSYLCSRLLKFRRWSDELPHAGFFFACFGVLLIVLVIDNACIWLVAAMDRRKGEYVPPLQDNVQLMLEWVQQRWPWVNVLWRWEWIGIKHKLVAVVMLALSVLFNQVPYSGFAMMSRTVLCVAISRSIRTVAFLLTILPSPRPGCYQRRFGPVPDTWLECWKLAFSKIRGSGGCNDLIISGHATIYVMAPLVYTSYYPGWTAVLLWLTVLRTCFRAPVTAQHYSIDMAMAVLISSLVWFNLDWVYPARNKIGLSDREFSDRRGPFVWFLTILIMLVLALLAYIIIGGGA